jgi:predicted nucleic acid-binding protein
MPVLVDTSVLGRLANRADIWHGAAQASIAKFDNLGEPLLITAQNLVEFRNFATRPLNLNGLRMSAAEASKFAAIFESTFGWLEEIPAIYPAWRNLVDAFSVIGKQVHDARLVAVCHVHQSTRF